ncbi:MAG: cytochrome c oxidase subunit II, partial [Actinobacteria bacterium]|nr:cytochrome c oxidase subunit II [Actinomycetota bacterium]
MILLGACGGGRENHQNVFKPKGTAAHKINSLFTPVAFIAVGVLVLVVGLLLVAVFKFRERPGHPTNVKQVHGNTPLEITWTVIPALILAVIAVPTVSTIFELARKPAGNVLEINVVGKQWWWQFEYPQEKIVTADEFVIPVHTQVRLALRACDPTLGTGYTGCSVIHSFWIPELAGKQDAVPGRTSHLNLKSDKTGTFVGQCAQYCGLGHARMRMRVKVVTAAEYADWVASQQRGPTQRFLVGTTSAPGAPSLITKTYTCTNCHVFDNSQKASYGPNLTHVGSRDVFASGAYPLTRDNLIKWVMDAPS